MTAIIVIGPSPSLTVITLEERFNAPPFNKPGQ